MERNGATSVGDKTKIEWADATWNPVSGCSQVSPGCAHCYAKAITERFGRVFEDVKLHEDRLRKPLSWKTPRRVFVNSMSDLFHESIPDEFIDKVFAVMALTPQHSYQVLTKRPERMREYVRTAFVDGARRIARSVPALAGTRPLDDADERILEALFGAKPNTTPQPLPNVWLGVSVENQHWADVRIPILLDTPAAVRFISAEPLLGPVDIRPYLERNGEGDDRTGSGDPFKESRGREISGDRGRLRDHLSGGFEDSARRPLGLISWVIIGGESGAKRRAFDLAWARGLKNQCDIRQIPVFFKQAGAFLPGVPSGDPELDAAKAWPL